MTLWAAEQNASYLLLNLNKLNFKEQFSIKARIIIVNSRRHKVKACAD